MNNRFLNIVLIILGFVVHFVFARSQEWNLLGVIGILTAGICLANLTYLVWPNRQNVGDWLIPVVLLALFGFGVYYLRTTGYFGLQGNTLYFVESLSLLLTVTPLARFYNCVIRLRQSIENS